MEGGVGGKPKVAGCARCDACAVERASEYTAPPPPPPTYIVHDIVRAALSASIHGERCFDERAGAGSPRSNTSRPAANEEAVDA